MTRCDDFHDAMAADAAGEIDPGTKAALTAHLDRCPACSRDHDRVRRALAGLGAEPVPDPGPLYWASFGGRLRERITRARSASRRRAHVLVAAAVVAVSGLGLALILRWPGRPAGIPGGPGGSRIAAGGAAAAGAAGAAGAGDGTGVAGGETSAEARLEAALLTMRDDRRAQADGALEAILDDVAPGDPFALAGGLDELDSDTESDSGV